jgi:hypothetical protein
MRGQIVHTKEKWYQYPIMERVILPVVFTGIALSVLVVMKHLGLID